MCVVVSFFGIFVFIHNILMYGRNRVVLCWYVTMLFILLLTVFNVYINNLHFAEMSGKWNFIWCGDDWWLIISLCEYIFFISN